VAGAVSCGSIPKTNYYGLRVPSPPGAHNPKTAAVLGIERLSAPEVLRDDRIVFYESPTQLNFYQYHRWSSDPATMIRDAIARRLGQAGLFAEVRLLPAREPVDYLLRGRVLNFEEVDYDSGVKGRAGLELTLVRAQDRKVLWTAARQAQDAAQGQGMAAVVEALNAASDRVLSELLPLLLAQAERDMQQRGLTPSPSEEQTGSL
jgi:ABC-type uncharacterized transport system auxiliary subunit